MFLFLLTAQEGRVSANRFAPLVIAQSLDAGASAPRCSICVSRGVV
jgi:hypothetical protein